MPLTKAGKAFTRLILVTFRFNGLLLAASDRLSKPLGLTSARWQVLGAIADEPRSVAQIARRMGLARQNVQRLADVLAGQGIVEYFPNPDHERAKLVRLTERGKRKLAELTVRQERWANQVASRVPKSGLEDTLAVIAKLQSSLMAEAERSPERQNS